ncbi:hypothetical protein D3Y57_04690 (plasmid) [Sphingomonas paeninsulae]|uniref:Uncharacterized protein n=1 Tax=Sphingomonas paeninsulae TaxID=2319844 RepID=A0A494TIR6_SPHPE|nr:hypothetical protein [Sphingomonas paeninsulae]AYJ85318.1 hypothetical protein D3Y57_04690 [Sphingomonas paeninsulae]
MMPREQNTPAKQAVKAASKALVRAAGGLEAAAEFSRPNKSVLGEYGRPEGDCFMPVDVVEDLEAITHGQAGHPIVTRHLAARAGYALVKLPTASDIDSDWLAQVGRLVSDSGAIIAGISSAAADKVINSADVGDFNLIGECDDLLALVVNMRAHFERIQAGGD